MQTFPSLVAALLIGLLAGCATKREVAFDPWTTPKLTTDEEHTIRELARAEGLGEIVGIEVERSLARSGFEIRALEQEQRNGDEIAQRILYVGSTKGTNGEIRRPFGHRRKGEFWTESIFTHRSISILPSGVELQVGLDERVAYEEARTVLNAYFDQLGALLGHVRWLAPDHNAANVYRILRGHDDSSFSLFLRRNDGRQDGQGISVRWNGGQLEVTGVVVLMS